MKRLEDNMNLLTSDINTRQDPIQNSIIIVCESILISADIIVIILELFVIAATIFANDNTSDDIGRKLDSQLDILLASLITLIRHENCVDEEDIMQLKTKP